MWGIFEKYLSENWNISLLTWVLTIDFNRILCAQWGIIGVTEPLTLTCENLFVSHTHENSNWDQKLTESCKSVDFKLD